MLMAKKLVWVDRSFITGMIRAVYPESWGEGKNVSGTIFLESYTKDIKAFEDWNKKRQK